MASATKLQRWLDLIAFLVARTFPVGIEQLMEGVPGYAGKWRTGDATARATAKRTFERDKDELRRLGIPLQTVPYTINYGTEQLEGYRIARRDFYLPYLRLVGGGGAAAEGEGEEKAGPGAGSPAGEVEIPAEDARLALEALRRVAELPSFPLAREARSAHRKLAFGLDPAAVRGAPVLFVDRPGAEELAARVRLLSDSLLARKRVRFRYSGIYRDQVTTRDVAPYGLLFQHGHWYLIGHDATRDAVRVFRAGRMDDVVPETRAPGTPDYEIPADFRLDDYANREAWELGAEGETPVRAEVLFHFPASLLAERNRRGELAERRDDGSQVRVFQVAQVNPFVRWLLSHEGEAEVLEPQELAAELRRLARAIAVAHGSEGARAPAGGADAGAAGDASGDSAGGTDPGGVSG